MMHGHSNSQVVSGPVGLVVVAKQICSMDTLRRVGVDDEQSKRHLVPALSRLMGILCETVRSSARKVWVHTNETNSSSATASSGANLDSIDYLQFNIGLIYAFRQFHHDGVTIVKVDEASLTTPDTLQYH